MSERPAFVTREHYIRSFRTWERVIRENEPERLVKLLPEISGFIAKLETQDLPAEAFVESYCLLAGPLVAGLEHRKLYLAIHKSSLLYRLLYNREPLRQYKCPTHQGHWSGLDAGLSLNMTDGLPYCPWGCQMTGWLHAEPDLRWDPDVFKYSIPFDQNCDSKE
jgi:hypothetical protein